MTAFVFDNIFLNLCLLKYSSQPDLPPKTLGFRPDIPCNVRIAGMPRFEAESITFHEIGKWCPCACTISKSPFLIIESMLRPKSIGMLKLLSVEYGQPGKKIEFIRCTLNFSDFKLLLSAICLGAIIVISCPLSINFVLIITI